MTSSLRKIFVAGHRGLVGSAIVRGLQRRAEGGEPLEIVTRTRAELELLDGAAVRAFLLAERPTHMVVAAAKVGGIKANNDFPVDFLLDNLKIQNGLIEGAHAAGVSKLLFLGSSCIYPKFAPQPIKEDSLLTGLLEPTNEAYAIAKIAGIKLCAAYRKQYGDDFISAMPTNMYGPFDNFDLQSSHVLPAMIHKFHLAKVERRPAMTLWGTGSPRREFLHADDLAEACLMLLEQYSSGEIINVGSGTDVTIKELAELRGGNPVGYDAARRHATQADGRHAHPRVRLEPAHRSARGNCERVPMVFGEPASEEILTRAELRSHEGVFFASGWLPVLCWAHAMDAKTAIKWGPAEGLLWPCADISFGYQDSDAVSLTMHFSRVRDGSPRDLSLKFTGAIGLRWESESSGSYPLPPSPPRCPDPLSRWIFRCFALSIPRGSKRSSPKTHRRQRGVFTFGLSPWTISCMCLRGQRW